MLSNKSLRIAGAAMLGTVAFLGTNAANATIDLDKPTDAVTYAKETLVKAVTGKDGSTYYVVEGISTELYVQGEIGIGGTAKSTLIVEYVFDGMVLTSGSSPSLKVGGDGANQRGGGKEGDSRVSFLVTRETALTSGAIATLTLKEMAVSANVTGSVTMNVRDDLPLPEPYTKGPQGAVRVASALKPVAMPMDAEATVEHKFLSFDGDTVETVGSFEVTVAVAPALRKAASGGNVDLKDLVKLGLNKNTANLEIDATVSSVTISGDFSFASKVTLEDSGTCTDASATDLRMKEDATTKMRDTTQLRPQTLAYINAAKFLCIHVLPDDDEDAVAIPETGPYMVTTKYVSAITGSKFPPSDGTYKLGSIGRDGTTVQLPYLTTNDRFNQRIYIVNRGSDTTYVMTFNGEGDEKGMDAEGSLPGGGTRTILSLRDDDVVTTPSGRSSTSGTLVIEAQPTMIDVATNQINRELGTSDTVVYPPD